MLLHTLTKIWSTQILQLCHTYPTPDRTAFHALWSTQLILTLCFWSLVQVKRVAILDIWIVCWSVAENSDSCISSTLDYDWKRLLQPCTILSISRFEYLFKQNRSAASSSIFAWSLHRKNSRKYSFKLLLLDWKISIILNIRQWWLTHL